MTSEVKLEPTAEEIERVMADAIDVADRLIEREFGMDVPQEWNDAFRSVQEARSRNRRASPPAPAVAVPDAFDLDSVREQRKEDGGLWRTCSGCYETEDGHPIGRYPHSEAFGCTLGAGCSECGGIGAVWDTTNYADMGDYIATCDELPAPAVAVPEGFLDALEDAAAGMRYVRQTYGDLAGVGFDRVQEKYLSVVRELAAAPQPPATRSYEEGKWDGRRDGIEAAANAQPSTAEDPNENAYQRGRFDGIMEYATAIRSLADEPRYGE